MSRCQLGGEKIARWDKDGVGTRGDKGKVNCNTCPIHLCVLCKERGHVDN